NVALGEPKRVVDEAQAHRLKIVEAAEAGDAFDAPRHDVRIGQEAHRKVSAGRMPDGVNLIRVAAVFADMRVHPGDRGAALAHLFVHANARDQRVIDDDIDEAGAGETERNIGAVLLVVADPVAAVDVDLHRREATRLFRPENVQTFSGSLVVWHVERASQSVARPRALFDPASALTFQPFFADLEPVVILAVERGAIVVAKNDGTHQRCSPGPVTMPYSFTLFTGVSGVSPPRRCAKVSLPVSSHFPVTARSA